MRSKNVSKRLEPYSKREHRTDISLSNLSEDIIDVIDELIVRRFAFYPSRVGAIRQYIMTENNVFSDLRKILELIKIKKKFNVNIPDDCVKVEDKIYRLIKK